MQKNLLSNSHFASFILLLVTFPVHFTESRSPYVDMGWKRQLGGHNYNCSYDKVLRARVHTLFDSSFYAESRNISFMCLQRMAP